MRDKVNPPDSVEQWMNSEMWNFVHGAADNLGLPEDQEAKLHHEMSVVVSTALRIERASHAPKEPDLAASVAEVKAARTAWLESFGVPISEEFARFLEAIGGLIYFAERGAPNDPVNEELVQTIARELYDRFVMGGWEPQDAYPQIREWLAGLSTPKDSAPEAIVHNFENTVQSALEEHSAALRTLWPSLRIDRASHLSNGGTESLGACGEYAGDLIAGASWFTCALPKGHEPSTATAAVNGHCRGGMCFKHGEYVGAQCPQWPDCTKGAPKDSVILEAMKAEFEPDSILQRKPNGGLE